MIYSFISLYRYRKILKFRYERNKKINSKSRFQKLSSRFIKRKLRLRLSEKKISKKNRKKKVFLREYLL